MKAWLDKLTETFLTSGYYKLMLEGLGNTVIITLGALAIGVVIGTVIAAVKYLAEDNRALAPAAWLCDAYVKIIRGIPVVVLLLIFYFVIFTSSEGVEVAVLTFGVNSGAYMAELIRGGIHAVDQGQMEAGRSLGLSRLQTMERIIFPQALRHILPAIGNEFIALIKETSVAGYVAVVDVTRAGNLVRNNTYDAVNSLMLVALTYLTLVLALTAVLERFEKKLNKGR